MEVLQPRGTQGGPSLPCHIGWSRRLQPPALETTCGRRILATPGVALSEVTSSTRQPQPVLIPLVTTSFLSISIFIWAQPPASGATCGRRILATPGVALSEVTPSGRQLLPMCPPMALPRGAHPILSPKLGAELTLKRSPRLPPVRSAVSPPLSSSPLLGPQLRAGWPGACAFCAWLVGATNRSRKPSATHLLKVSPPAPNLAVQGQWEGVAVGGVGVGWSSRHWAPRRIFFSWPRL